jgi:hypothetical protein
MPHRSERRPFVSLLERMRLCNPSQQSYCEHNNIFLAIGEGILGRANVPSSRPISRRKCRSPVSSTSSLFFSITASMGSQRGSFGKSGSQFGEARHEFAAQCLVIDLAFDRFCSPNFAIWFCLVFFGQLPEQ